MRVMVLGATGFIGPAVAERLAARGCAVLAVSRSGGGAATQDVRGVATDRRDGEAIARLARAERIDAIIDLIAYTQADTLPLIAALRGQIGRYVLASSGDVYRQYDALHRREQGRPVLDRLEEDAPLRTIPFPYRTDPPRAADDPLAWMDDYDKIPLEAVARESLGAAGVIVRLPMVYGPNDRNRRFAWALRPMLANAPALEIDEAWAAWRSGYGYVENVAEALALAAVHPAAAGRTYNASPEETPDHLTWAHRLADLLGWNGDIHTVPREKVGGRTRAALDGLDLAYPMAADGTRIRRELGYAEPVDLQTALSRTVEDERRRG